MLTDDTSSSLQNNNNSQLLLLSLPLLLSLSVAQVASNNADNDSNLSSLSGDQSNITFKCSKDKKRCR